MRSSRSLGSTNVVVKLKKEMGGCGEDGGGLMLKALKPFSFYLFCFACLFHFTEKILFFFFSWHEGIFSYFQGIFFR